jgi:HK97 family phage major capsid protein
MGRIKELQDKKISDGLNEKEEAELKELLDEATATKDVEPEVEETVDAEVEELADKLVEAAQVKTSAFEEKLDKVLKAISENEVKEVETPGFIYDSKLGKKSVDELSEIKVVVPGRKEKGKAFSEVTAKTTHFIKALVDADREKLQLLTEGTGSAGGFLVPEEFANMIIEDRRDATVMRQIADVLTTNTDTFHLPSLDTRPKANWRSEGAVKSTSTVQFSENVFTPYSLASIVGLSTELEADASLGVGGSIVNYVAGLMSRSLAEAEDTAFWTGNGTGRPTGISTYGLGTFASGVTDVQRADSVQQTYRRLPQGYRNSAVWVANSTTWESIDRLKDGNNQYLLRGLADSPTPVLKGRPVYEQNDIAGGTLYFGDFSFYKIVDRQGIRVDISREATVASTSAFESNLVFIRVESRVDGELTLTQAIRSVTNMGTP